MPGEIKVTLTETYYVCHTSFPVTPSTLSNGQQGILCIRRFVGVAYYHSRQITNGYRKPLILNAGAFKLI